MRRRLANRSWIALAALVLATGCGLDAPDAVSPLAPLITVQGQAYLPIGFHVAGADALPVPDTYTMQLQTLAGVPVAEGSMATGTGGFTVSVPTNDLGSQPQVYALALQDAQGDPVYLAPVRLSAGMQSSAVDVTARSTVLTLVAKAAAAQGGNPVVWNFGVLARDTSVDPVAEALRQQVVAWSQGGGQPPAAAPGDALRRQIAALVARGLASGQTGP